VGLALGAFRSGVWVSSLAGAFLAAWVAARTWADTGFSGGILREWIRRFGATETVPPTGDPSDEIETASAPSRRTETHAEGAEHEQGATLQLKRGRHVATIAAVLLTVLSISYFVLKALSSVLRFDIPGLPVLRDLGQRFLPAPLLPLLPALVPALAWLGWGLVVARHRWRSRELRRAEEPTPAGTNPPMASHRPGMTRRLLRA